MELIGELAALTTAFSWALTSIFFASAGRRIGSFHVNKIRLVMAVALYAAAMTLRSGHPLPIGLNGNQIFWLALSGFAGLVFGDGCGFKALVMIGPRLATLIYATTPIMTTTIAWFMIDEKLAWIDLFGIAITLSGVSWVVAERRYKKTPAASVALDHPDAGSLTKGVLFGLGAALGQASGLVLAKHAMFDFGGEVDPMSASMIRMIAGMVIIWSISLFRGTIPTTIKAISNKRAMLMCAGGAIAGPFFGVWMSLLALKYIAAGIAATFNHTTPIMVIPLLWLVYRERTTARGLLGAAVAVGGVALLVLS